MFFHCFFVVVDSSYKVKNISSIFQTQNLSISKTAILEPQTIIESNSVLGLSNLNKAVSEPHLDIKQPIASVNTGSTGNIEKLEPRDHKNGCVIM